MKKILLPSALILLACGAMACAESKCDPGDSACIEQCVIDHCGENTDTSLSGVLNYSACAVDLGDVCVEYKGEVKDCASDDLMCMGYCLKNQCGSKPQESELSSMLTYLACIADVGNICLASDDK